MNILVKTLGYTFTDNSLLELALTHRSFGANNNERLEFLGDSILNCIIAAELVARYPKSTEGQLTRMRAQLVCENMLTVVAKELGVGKFVILGAGEQRSGGHQRASILADSVEAIIGAIYQDSNFSFDTVKHTVLKWYQDKFAIFNDIKVQGHKDPKTVLQELLQAKQLELPDYQVIKIEGEQHEQTFYVRCTVALLAEPVEGVGNSRRRAEQMAAEKILALLNYVQK